MPVSPIHPQDPDAVGALASWLAPTDGDTARRLTALATTTAAFAAADDHPDLDPAAVPDLSRLEA